MTRRRQDWPEQLNTFIESVRYASFEWGKTDCCLLPADAILAMTGDDLAWWFRGIYSDAAGALRALKRYAGGNIAETFAKAMADAGLAEIGANYAQRGDLVLLPSSGIYAEHFPHLGGICIGTHAVTFSDKGLIAVPMALALRAWRVA